MDFEDFMDSVVFPLSAIAAYGTSCALLVWHFGWSWWWAVPVSVPLALLGPVATGVLCGILDACGLYDWGGPLPIDHEDEPPPSADPVADTGGEVGDYRRLKRALAKILHPDSHRAASDAERALREAVFKEVWAEVERIEGR